MKSANRLERLNEEIKRRTPVVRILPDTESCRYSARALCAETTKTGLGQARAHMDYCKE